MNSASAHPRLAKSAIAGLLLFVCSLLAPFSTADEWEKLADGKPTMRDIFAMAYDAARDVVVLHGGVIGRQQNAGDTWEFDGEEWRRVAEGGPGRRHAPAMTYDSSRGVVLLVAGAWHDNDVYHNAGDTWAWDGKAWEKLADSGPPACHGPSMAFDSSRGVAVFFGGFRARDLPGDARRHDFSGETWEWDGKSWEKKSKNGPAPRYGSAMAYDPVRKLTYLFGGRDHAGNEHTDTWAWDGKVWQQIDVKGPRSTTGHVLIWNPEMQRSILLGGYDFKGENPRDPVREVWSWNGSEWTRLPNDLPYAFSWPTATAAPGGGILLVGNKDNATMETWRLKGSTVDK